MDRAMLTGTEDADTLQRVMKHERRPRKRHGLQMRYLIAGGQAWTRTTQG